jgi:hypothetical protein
MIPLPGLKSGRTNLLVGERTAVVHQGKALLSLAVGAGGRLYKATLKSGGTSVGNSSCLPMIRPRVMPTSSS